MRVIVLFFLLNFIVIITFTMWHDREQSGLNQAKRKIEKWTRIIKVIVTWLEKAIKQI